MMVYSDKFFALAGSIEDLVGQGTAADELFCNSDGLEAAYGSLHLSVKRNTDKKLTHPDLVTRPVSK
jgi:hypothetical protein